MQSGAQRRPKPLGVDERKDPDDIAIDLIDETITAMGRHFARTRNFPFMAQPGMISESGNGGAKHFVDTHRCVSIAFEKIVPDVCAILPGLRRPADDHA